VPHFSRESGKLGHYLLVGGGSVRIPIHAWSYRGTAISPAVRKISHKAKDVVPGDPSLRLKSGYARDDAIEKSTCEI